MHATQIENKGVLVVLLTYWCNVDVL